MKPIIQFIAAAVVLTALVACQNPALSTADPLGPSSQAKAIGSGTTGEFTLKAQANNRFVCADLDLAANLMANRDAAQDWETFTLVPMTGDNKFALKAKANGKFVCVDLNKQGLLVADRDAAQGWETFTLVAQGGDNYALRADANGKYVCADLDKGSQLIANRDAAQGWETFTFTQNGNSQFSWNNPSTGVTINGVQANGTVTVQKSGGWDTIIPPQAGMKIVNNTWGIGSPYYNGTGTATVFAETIKETPVFGWSWDLQSLKSNSVITYQEIGWGWSPNSGEFFNGAVALNKLNSGKKYYVDFDLKRTDRSGAWNTAFDIWLYPQEKPTGGSGGKKGGYEIMIWLDYQTQGPWGSNPQDVTINGRSWKVYDNDGSAGWRVISYLIQGSPVNSVRNWDLTAFMEDAANRYSAGIANSVGLSRDHYINAVEFGSESCGGRGMLEVANYKLDIR